MQLTPNEIDKIEDAGMLDNNPVKLIRTKGGFWIAIGRKKNKATEEALGAGSHPAIVKYNLEKQYPEFQPAMAKSEFASGLAEVVQKHSHFLSEELRKSGHDIFSIQTGNTVEFQITKQNAALVSVNAYIDGDSLAIHDLNIPKAFTKAMAGATVEKAVTCNVGLKLRK